MTINPATTVSVATAGLTPAPATHKTALDASDFMKMMLSELENQNPMEPMDNKDYMAQMAQMNSVEELQKMNQTLTQLASGSKLSEAANLIGRKVDATLSDGTTTSGLVSSVTMVNNDVLLSVGDQQVAYSAVVSVSAPDTTAHA